MGNAKQTAQELIETLPENVTMDEILDLLYSRQIIEEGLDQLDQGNSVPAEEVWERLKKWLE
jgi:hypothetical protein